MALGRCLAVNAQQHASGSGGGAEQTEVMLIAAAPIDAPAAEAVMTRAGTENFPVASRVLPRRVRSHLLAVYGYARLVDELGDADDLPPAHRLAALDWLEGELDRAFRGDASHPLLVRLQATVHECSLAREPFARLIEANRVDQRVSRYETWAQLRAYCALSADPVGELVLGVFGAATPARIALSNSICTALQLAEHCQDVAEDIARGRVYVPARGPQAVRLPGRRPGGGSRERPAAGGARLRGRPRARAAGRRRTPDRPAAGPTQARRRCVRGRRARRPGCD